MPTLNEQIQALRSGQPADWEHDTDQALSLLEEVTAGQARQWDIFLTWEDGQIIYEVTNIFMVDEDGDILLVRGWTGKERPIDAKAPTLAGSACRAWLMLQGADLEDPKLS